jgi:uncharacterized damage-inducible protein DinB
MGLLISHQRRSEMTPFYEELFELYRGLHADIEAAFQDLPLEALDWSPGPEMNSIAVLVVHLTGAEKFLVSDIVMGQPSGRDRPAEFRAAGLSAHELAVRLHQAETVLRASFEQLSLQDLEAERLDPRNGKTVRPAWALLHALEHAGVHTGQIQLISQMWKQRHTTQPISVH